MQGVFLSIILCLLFIIFHVKIARGTEQNRPPENMVLVKGGCFDMGDAFGDGDRDERPVHEVCVDDFYIGKYEVTVGEFKKFVEETGYKTEAEKGNGCATWIENRWIYKPDRTWFNPGFPQSDKHPVVCVSWNDAMEYIKWKNKSENRNYRLPTEAEWEYAARDRGKKYKYSWGNGEPAGNIADKTAKKKFRDWTILEGYDDGYVYTAPVGSFKPNDAGLHDMTGNAWEWVYDWYEPDYYSKGIKNNPKGPETGRLKIARGGAWINFPWFLRTTLRDTNEPDDRSDIMGFRIALPAK